MKLRDNIAISESGFVFDAHSGDSFNLNGEARFILNLLKENTNENTLKEKIRTEYEIDDFDLDQFLYDFLKKLDEFNLLIYE